MATSQIKSTSSGMPYLSGSSVNVDSGIKVESNTESIVVHTENLYKTALAIEFDTENLKTVFLNFYRYLNLFDKNTGNYLYVCENFVIVQKIMMNSNNTFTFHFEPNETQANIDNYSFELCINDKLIFSGTVETTPENSLYISDLPEFSRPKVCESSRFEFHTVAILKAESDALSALVHHPISTSEQFVDMISEKLSSHFPKCKAQIKSVMNTALHSLTRKNTDYYQTHDTKGDSSLDEDTLLVDYLPDTSKTEEDAVYLSHTDAINPEKYVTYSAKFDFKEIEIFFPIEYATQLEFLYSQESCKYFTLKQYLQELHQVVENESIDANFVPIAQRLKAIIGIHDLKSEQISKQLESLSNIHLNQCSLKELIFRC